MSDDVIVWGRTQQEHNTALESVPQRFRDERTDSGWSKMSLEEN